MLVVESIGRQIFGFESPAVVAAIQNAARNIE